MYARRREPADPWYRDRRREALSARPGRRPTWASAAVAAGAAMDLDRQVDDGLEIGEAPMIFGDLERFVGEQADDAGVRAGGEAPDAQVRAPRVARRPATPPRLTGAAPGRAVAGRARRRLGARG